VSSLAGRIRDLYAEEEVAVPEPIRHSAKEELKHAVQVEANKQQVQVFSPELYQWYSMEVCKAFCLNENRRIVDDIFADGLKRGHKPFVNRPITTEVSGAHLNVFTSPTIVPDREATMLHWYIPWMHNQPTPGFITYSSLPYVVDGVYYRLIDIDYDEDPTKSQMQHYGSASDFGSYYSKVCAVNTVARKLDRATVTSYQKLLQVFSDSMVSTLGEQNLGSKPLFSGGGFRLIAKADSAPSLKEKINKWVSDGKICSSSTVDFQPQKLFSPQTLSPHLQTEVDPYSRDFKFSNPTFYFCRYTGQLLENILAYYRLFVKETYTTELGPTLTDAGTLYSVMREKQANLEQSILFEVRKNS
jgi:hypothetical protein